MEGLAREAERERIRGGHERGEAALLRGLQVRVVIAVCVCLCVY